MYEWIVMITITLAALAVTPSKGRRRTGRKRAAGGRQRGRTLTIQARQTASRRSREKYIDPAQIEAMEAQIEAACNLARAYDKQVQSLQAELTAAKSRAAKLDSWGGMDYKVETIRTQIDKNEVKRARLAQQSANAYARAARIQAQIDKMMLTA